MTAGKCLYQLPGGYRRCGRPAEWVEGGLLCPCHAKLKARRARVAQLEAGRPAESAAASRPLPLGLPGFGTEDS